MYFDHLHPHIPPLSPLRSTTPTSCPLTESNLCCPYVCGNETIPRVLVPTSGHTLKKVVFLSPSSWLSVAPQLRVRSWAPTQVNTCLGKEEQRKRQVLICQEPPHRHCDMALGVYPAKIGCGKMMGKPKLCLLRNQGGTRLYVWATTTKPKPSLLW